MDNGCRMRKGDAAIWPKNIYGYILEREMRALRASICVPKASLQENPRNLQEKILEFIALEGICKSFNAEHEEFAKVAKLF